MFHEATPFVAIRCFIANSPDLFDIIKAKGKV